MNTTTTTTTTIRIVFCLMLSSMTAAFDAIEARGEVRKFAFADAYPTGRLTVLSCAGCKESAIPASTAKGHVSMSVPPGGVVVLEINPRCLEQPEKMATIPTVGIDQISISYMSMDDDAHVCDRALAAMPLFKKALILECVRTDVSDAGLLNFKSLPSVTRLNCLLSDVNGSFLKESKRLQNLQFLNLSHDSLKEENLKAISQLKSLQIVNFRETNLTDEGLQEICKNPNLTSLNVSSNARLTDQGLQCLSQCSALENLDIAHDKNITDKSIPVIQKLAHLKYLDISYTKISEPALEKLKNLKLISIMLPGNYWKVDKIKLKKAFPATVLNFANGQVSSDMQTQLAPLK